MTETSARTRTRWLVAAAIAVAALVGVGIGAVVASNDDTSDATNVTASQQLAAWRNACQQWSDSYDSTEARAPGSAWCHGMGDWMYEQMRGGAIGPMMMWGNPERMRDACRQWASTDASGVSGDDVSTWCNSMVAWMTDRMGNWSGWDDEDWDDWMHGPMMGR